MYVSIQFYEVVGSRVGLSFKFIELPNQCCSFLSCARIPVATSFTLTLKLLETHVQILSEIESLGTWPSRNIWWLLKILNRWHMASWLWLFLSLNLLHESNLLVFCHLLIRRLARMWIRWHISMRRKLRPAWLLQQMLLLIMKLRLSQVAIQWSCVLMLVLR